MKRIKAWDHLYEETRMIHQLGYQVDEDKIPLERKHVRDALSLLGDGNLTSAQIVAIEDLMYYSYIIGRDAK